jgi:biopolymer transport protein ExbB/TolQ
MPDMPASSRRRWIAAGLVVGGLLTISPLLGVLGTIFGMMNAFAALGADGAAGDSEVLSRGIGQALVATAAGLILFVPGVIILIVSFIHYRRAKRAALPLQTPPP